MAGLGTWVFRPLDKAAKGRRCPTQFTIVDFLCLFFIIQLPTALIHSGTLGETPPPLLVLDGFVWISCGLIWWKSVEVMSRAGIHRPWHRIVFLTVVNPLTIVAGFVIPVVPVMLLLSLMFGPPPIKAQLVLLGIAGVAAGGLVFCVWFTRRMVAATAPPEELEPDATAVAAAMMAVAENAKRQPPDVPMN